MAVDQGTYIATSNDGGSTWNEQYNPDKHTWASITSSADGTKLAAVGDSHIYISTDSGVKWKQVENLDNIAWQSISLSADGTKLAAAPLRDCIYISNDSGATWIKKTASGIANWVSITSSSDGTKLAAATNKEEVVDGQSSYSGYVYVSSDNGDTWVNKTPEGGRNWRSITSSASGSKIFAGSPNRYVFNFQNSSIAPEAVVNILKTSSANKTIAPSSKILTASAPANLRGKILIQVESHGEAWYINPKDGKRYYMANGGEALKIMRNFGIGISNKDADKMKIDANFRKIFMGKILLQVESHGEAYYISFDGRYNYLKDGDAALAVMKKLGLGISNSNLEKISAN